MCLWRTLSGALAVVECLNDHGIQSSLVCKVYNAASESIEHVLFDSFPDRTMWRNLGIQLPVVSNINKLEQLMCYCFEVIEKKPYDDTICLALPWLLWGLWKHRNVVVFESKHGDINKLIDTASEDADLWKKEQDKVNLGDRRVKRERNILENKFFKPSVGHLKCNVHASWVNQLFMCGGAWIIRDSTGSVLFHARDVFTPATNRLTAELRCIEWTVSRLVDLHLDHVEIWSHSVSAIDVINNPWKWPRYQGVLGNIQNYCGAFQVIKFRVSSPQVNSDGSDRTYLLVDRHGCIKGYKKRVKSNGFCFNLALFRCCYFSLQTLVLFGLSMNNDMILASSKDLEHGAWMGNEVMDEHKAKGAWKALIGPKT